MEQVLAGKAGKGFPSDLGLLPAKPPCWKLL